MSNDQNIQINLANIPQLLAHALALELEASERYADLADLMEAHNNYDVASLFKKMSGIEKLHVNHIQEMVHRHRIKSLPQVSYHWASPEGPETTDIIDLHYLMNPRQALKLAMYNEQRACDYYANIAANTQDEETRRLAQELSAEEAEHVGMVRVWMDKYPEPEADWDQDDDPPFQPD